MSISDWLDKATKAAAHYNAADTTAGYTSGPMPWLNNNNNQNSNNSGSGYGGYGGGYYSGGGGSSGPTEKQQKTFDNLGAIVGANKQTLLDDFNNKSDMLNIADQSNKNILDFTVNNNRTKAGTDWYKQVQNLQSSVDRLGDSLGNASYSSTYQDLMDLIARKYDQDAVETLNSLRDNNNDADSNYFQALAQNINSHNQQAAETYRAIRELGTDYLAQGNNIDPDLVEDYLDTEGHTVDLPDWLKADEFYNENKRGAIETPNRGLIRDANEVQTAIANNLRGQSKERNVEASTAANENYWTRIRNGYSRRTQ